MLHSRVFIVFELLLFFCLVESRFRFPFKSDLNASMRRRPMPVNAPISQMGAASLSRAVSYENINLSQRRQPAFMSPSSSQNSLHHSESSVSLNSANSQSIASGVLHREAASILNVDRINTVRHRLIPKFIRKYEEQIKTAGTILEKSGIAVAAVGGALVIHDALSDDTQIKKMCKSENDNGESITPNSISMVEPTSVAINAITSAVSDAVITSTTTKTEKPKLNNPIGRDK